MTPWRTRSLLSRSIALWTAVARWRTPAVGTEFDQLCDDCQRRNRSLKADNTARPPMRLSPMSPAGCFSRNCRKRLSRSGPFEPAYATPPVTTAASQGTHNGGTGVTVSFAQDRGRASEAQLRPAGDAHACYDQRHPGCQRAGLRRFQTNGGRR
jgi:hypothetical protein